MKSQAQGKQTAAATGPGIRRPKEKQRTSRKDTSPPYRPPTKTNWKTGTEAYQTNPTELDKSTRHHQAGTDTRDWRPQPVPMREGGEALHGPIPTGPQEKTTDTPLTQARTSTDGLDKARTELSNRPGYCTEDRPQRVSKGIDRARP